MGLIGPGRSGRPGGLGTCKRARVCSGLRGIMEDGKRFEGVEGFIGAQG